MAPRVWRSALKGTGQPASVQEWGDAMKRKLLISLSVAVLALATIGSALASQPPGQLGYEGQPGNQGGGGAQGLQGYEGQPGNQGSH